MVRNTDSDPPIIKKDAQATGSDVQRLLIIGAGGHAKVVADAAIAAGDLQVVGFADDDARLQGRVIIADIRVLGGTPEVASLPHDLLVIAIGSNKLRRRMFETFSKMGHRFATVVHPRAVVARGVTVGAGTVIFAGSVVNVGAHVGSNVIVNTSSSIDHDTWIRDHAHIAPGARIAGGCRVGEAALIGIGAVILPMRSVGAETIVGAGAVVTNDLPENVVAVGIPARVRG